MNLSGNPTDFLLAFAGGLLVSLTPCVYPLIPITAGFIAGKAVKTRWKALALSFCYVTGMAITYSALGIIASLTGTLFGKYTQSPVTYFFVGALVIIFGLGMLDVFTFSVSNFIKLPKVSSGNYFSALLLGLGSGLIVGPCITPALGSILAYIATKQNVIYGATLLFVFAYGLGTILIVVGTSSGIAASLPKSGKWMGIIKKSCAIILIGAGMYFIYTGIRRM